MSENTPQQPPEGDPQRPPHQPPSQPPPPSGGQPPAGPPPGGHEPYHGGPQPYGQQPYGAQPGPPPDPNLRDPNLYPGVEYPPDRTAGMVGPAGENFFASLFDYSFTRYITPTIVKVVYVVITILVALGWLGALIASFSAGWLPGVLFLVFGWIIALIYLALARISLEFFVAVISVSEKVNRYAERDGLS